MGMVTTCRVARLLTVAEAAYSPQRQINLWAALCASVAILKSLTYSVNIFGNGIV